MNKPFNITELLNELYQGFEDQHDREFICITTRKYFKKHKILPTDKEAGKWFDENIGNTKCSASSGIFKFRLFLKSRLKN